MVGYLIIALLIVVLLFGLKWEEWRRRAADEFYYYRRSSYRSPVVERWVEKLWLIAKIGAFLFLLHIFLQMCGGRRGF